jgi:hypothetical protein
MGVITDSPLQDQTSLPLKSAINQGLEDTPPTPVLLERSPSKESIVQQNPSLKTTLAIASCTTSTSFLSAMAGQSVLLMLPAIGRDLEISQENLTWILNSYVLSYVSTHVHICCNRYCATWLIPSGHIMTGLSTSPLWPDRRHHLQEIHLHPGHVPLLRIQPRLRPGP